MAVIMLNANWSIIQINCRPLLNGKENVVHEVIWECRITSDEAPNEFIAHSEAMSIPYSQGPFTSYENLTEQQVVGWVKDQIGPLVGPIEDSLKEQLRIKLLPPTVTLELPWK